MAKFLGNSNGNSEDMKNDKEQNPEIIGDVDIHVTANIHPCTVIGPNVSIGQNVQVATKLWNVQTAVKVTKIVYYLLEHIHKVHKKAKNIACASCDDIFCWKKCPGNCLFEIP